MKKERHPVYGCLTLAMWAAFNGRDSTVETQRYLERCACNRAWSVRMRRAVAKAARFCERRRRALKRNQLPRQPI